MMLRCLSKSLTVPKNPVVTATASIHTTNVVCKVQAGRYKHTKKRDFPLTYEMSMAPHKIAHKKSWNAWNTSSLQGGLRRSETAIEDEFIRRFMIGTFHGMVLSELIIKRQFNHIRIAAILKQAITPTKFYFLIGYTEELLSNWMQCPVTLELQTTPSEKDVIFTYC